MALAVCVLACGAIYQLVTIRRMSKQAKAWMLEQNVGEVFMFAALLHQLNGNPGGGRREETFEGLAAGVGRLSAKLNPTTMESIMHVLQPGCNGSQFSTLSNCPGGRNCKSNRPALEKTTHRTRVGEHQAERSHRGTRRSCCSSKSGMPSFFSSLSVDGFCFRAVKQPGPG